MKKKEISDDEIQILGLEYKKTEATQPFLKKKQVVAGVLLAIAIIIVSIVLLIYKNYKSNLPVETKPVAVQLDIHSEKAAPAGYIEVSEETVNDVPLRIYVPKNVIPELSLSIPDEADSTVVFVTQAADIGENDYGIVGDFVLKGEVLAKGVKKEGFCSIINNILTVGVSSQTSLLQDAIQEKGYFFRQYPLVSNSKAIYNKPKGKSIRRALAIRKGEILMIESRDRESLNDFAQALADSGISEAIYLMGTEYVYGWYIDEKGNQNFFGPQREYVGEGENFLVWRRK